MPFMDQILDRLAKKGWYCFLMGIQVTTKSLLHWRINRKPPLLVLSRSRGFLLCCVMHRLLFNDVWCRYYNLVLNWEKYHFMVKDSIVLGHRISKKGIEVDRAKVEMIERLPPPISVKGVRSFLGHAVFYQRLSKDFSKITHPMCKLLEKECKFYFDESRLKAFDKMKEKLVCTPIIISPD